MKLILKEQYEKLRSNATKSFGISLSSLPTSMLEKSITDEKVVVKWFNPSGQATWCVFSIDDNGDCFGVAQLFGRDTREYGYFNIDEIKAIKCPPFGLGIERDMHYTSQTFGEII